MRAIKFRAWDKEKKCLIAVPNLYLGDDGSGRTIMILLRTAEGHGRTLVAGENCELMQFTGLVDKNGKEVYEGDILRLGYSDGSWNKAPVAVAYGLHDVGFDSDCCSTGPALGFYFSPYAALYHDGRRVGLGEEFNWESPMEVIGNIYENAELLKDSA